MVNVVSFIKDYLFDQEDGIRQLITWFLNLVMEEEALLQSGAKRYERTDSRKASRNGYKPRTLLTKYGELELLKPQFREFPFETEVFEKYSRVEKAILAAVSESYLQGVSTRRVDKIMTALGVEGISASSVSRITKELDQKVEEFLSKPIEHEIPYLFIDATYLKVRDGLHYENKALFIVAGVRDDGYREILGARLADSEDSLFWQDLFEDLKVRGLRGVKLIVSDGHKGIQKAVRESFVGSSWQMCHVHLIRQALKKVPKKKQKEVADKIKEALVDRQKLQELIRELDKMGYKSAADTLESFQYDVMNYMQFPQSHWRRIRTTNIMERTNKEIKRRTKVVGAFPSQESVLRLGVSILIDINEEWITGNKYLIMEQ
ncbi:Mobile element protein [Methanosarcina horonobensis HB-1 = JCM 15518]|uniref:Mobile element protein n=1 Tax=Methanosarcina horonobensis HB-1 = JCM 15518 TaxID=1434110 RepID=A0A0E3SJS2_9EURY|nr:Mobile element protein [Methanosarcina horonobensis HB-1 = JCM 15518]AKB79564.1 Mobile element protein [Methanosarcina horonobensis HB-1 = JCM 15518]AKB80578.1 Mobile element protein [Methanosarcina horonobensis HB-1 = JCM 15518]